MLVLRDLSVCACFLFFVTACGADEDSENVGGVCDTAPIELESTTKEKMESAGLFAGRFRCSGDDLEGAFFAQFYEDGTFEDRHENSGVPPEPGEDPFIHSIRREDGRYHFEDGVLIARDENPDAVSDRLFQSNAGLKVIPGDDGELSFHTSNRPFERTEGGDDIAGSRFENDSRTLEFEEDRVTQGLFDEEFTDWSYAEYEYRIDDNVLLLSAFGDSGEELIPILQFDLQGGCLKNWSVKPWVTCRLEE